MAAFKWLGAWLKGEENTETKPGAKKSHSGPAKLEADTGKEEGTEGSGEATAEEEGVETAGETEVGETASREEGEVDVEEVAAEEKGVGERGETTIGMGETAREEEKVDAGEAEEVAAEEKGVETAGESGETAITGESELKETTVGGEGGVDAGEREEGSVENEEAGEVETTAGKEGEVDAEERGEDTSTVISESGPAAAGEESAMNTELEQEN